ncbi:Hypothetical protein LUCI_4716 [Lucifera butyrica]|uniref:DUF1659 domain-containing protein n=1 Tax=Lucifera butyrica TaxID=1351585 RepID=A0A498R9P8_9FIRM|nr:DUF1659 domain-containing protein [Lucifera butyrica]VBB09426.1 Hypothetical protein LUCI_4716 [Lucifera butyrica]
MAVANMPQSTKLVVKVQTGTNSAGKPAYKTRSYQGVKTTAADSDVYAVGQGLGNLQSYPVAAITRLDEDNLVNQ